MIVLASAGHGGDTLRPPGRGRNGNRGFFGGGLKPERATRGFYAPPAKRGPQVARGAVPAALSVERQR